MKQALFFIPLHEHNLVKMLSIILYFVGLLRTLLVIAVIYLVVRWLTRLFIQGSQSAQRRQGSNEPQKPNEGETTIRYKPGGEKIVDKDKGEYVDFEEVD